VASGSGPLIYVWKKNGTIISGQTGNTLTLANVSYADAGNYSVEVTGPCNTAVQSATLTINLPPTVSITTPTNGATFVFPQAVPTLAEASDPDGTVSKVELFQGITKLCEAEATPCYYFWTNVPVGNYQLTARATDNLGLMATSSVVNITMLDHAPLAAGPIQLNRQNGLFQQSVTITNPTPYTFLAVRIWIENLPTECQVVNATGTNNGVPYIDYNLPIAGGATGSLFIQYYVPSRIPPAPTLIPEVLGTDYGAAKLPPTAQVINSCQRQPDGSFMIEFYANANYTYRVQYCSALGEGWSTAAGTITGTGGMVQWIDNGPPKTDSHPSTKPSRFYRIMASAP